MKTPKEIYSAMPIATKIVYWLGMISLCSMGCGDNYTTTQYKWRLWHPLTWVWILILSTIAFFFCLADWAIEAYKLFNNGI